MIGKTQSEKDLARMKKKIAHGYRVITCPKCGMSVRGKWMEKVLQHAGHYELNKFNKKVLVRCGYFDPEYYFEDSLGVLHKLVKDDDKSKRA